MPDKIIELMPFLCAVGGKTQLNVPRIFESAIIIALTALMTSYIGVQIIEVRLLHIEHKIVKVEESVTQMRHDLYQPIHIPTK